ncbi:hypothetical protein Tco_0967176 [Tanacetum coccineum]
MELYMMNRPHGRMILASVEKGPLVWPSITEDGVTRLKQYVELTPVESIQADYDIKSINIILQGLPTEIYALWSQHQVLQIDLWEKIKLLNAKERRPEIDLIGESIRIIALSFEKPFYLKKVRESKPKLYDGNVILKMDTIVIPDSDETLMRCEESHPSHSSTTIKVEVPKELPKVSMVYTSLKELKRYLTGFDLVVKERTTATAITEGTWGFEHTKAYLASVMFELSELRAQSQAKDTVIVKLKEQIKSLKGNVDDSKVKMDMDEIETLNIELEHRDLAFSDDCMSSDNLCISNSMNDVKFCAKPKKRKSKKDI